METATAEVAPVKPKRASPPKPVMDEQAIREEAYSAGRADEREAVREAVLVILDEMKERCSKGPNGRVARHIVTQAIMSIHAAIPEAE